MQEDAKQAIQRKCEIRFTLAHSAPIMKSLLGDWVRYLSDESLAQSIIMGTYEFPSDLDPATRLVLEEIGILGVKILCYSIHVDKYSKYLLHPSTFVYVYYVSEATRMTGYGPD